MVSNKDLGASATPIGLSPAVGRVRVSPAPPLQSLARSILRDRGGSRTRATAGTTLRPSYRLMALWRIAGSRRCLVTTRKPPQMPT